MGRHRRTAPEALPAGNPARHRGGQRVAAPVRTGLLGVSAAVAVGAAAVTSGLLPGQGGEYTVGSETPGSRVRTGDLPEQQPRDTPATRPTGRSSAPADRGSGRSEAPGGPSSRPGTPAAPSGKTPERPSSSAPAEDSPATPSGTAGEEKGKPASAGPERPAGEEAAEAEVLKLVNHERARAGCRPVKPDRRLGGLADDFSEDMADRDFFDHTDPDGATPWDRAKGQGIGALLGGENIARGQRDAAAVMDAWMDSPGHRANILNCGYRTLGVGTHYGDGGPWWTQDFGY
ncbi:CAP domain-containing protein [Streptomyces sp. NPDC001922]|uniref:CAP domain-containing protein n=1 Tax=Streptomyces sp. NPDC001922 TaxID=3364624 RepID=UPI0036C70A52